MFTCEILPLRQLKVKYAAWVMDQCAHKGEAAKCLGVARNTLDVLLAKAGHPSQSVPHPYPRLSKEQKAELDRRVREAKDEFFRGVVVQ
jgi:hypothetical protein